MVTFVPASMHRFDSGLPAAYRSTRFLPNVLHQMLSPWHDTYPVHILDASAAIKDSNYYPSILSSRRCGSAFISRAQSPNNVTVSVAA